MLPRYRFFLGCQGLRHKTLRSSSGAPIQAVGLLLVEPPVLAKLKPVKEGVSSVLGHAIGAA